MESPTDEYVVRWPYGRATVSATAGMLLGGGFILESGFFEPFALAPWVADRAVEAGLPGHLRLLGGEFVAIPFGSAGVPDDVTGPWAQFAGSAPPDPAHGPSADQEWRVTHATGSRIELALDYPEPSPISRLERTVQGGPDDAVLRFELTIHARRAAHIAVGLHPILRLPRDEGALELSVAFGRGYSYPWTVVAGASRVAAGCSFERLDEVPSAAGGATVDASRYPSAAATEEVLQLCEVSSPVTAHYRDEGVQVTLDWDRSMLPSLLLWHSDRALGEEPWDHSYRGLGIEPIAAAFDLPPAVSTAPNPLREAGHATSLGITPDSPTVIRYSIGARAISRTATEPGNETKVQS